MKIAKIYIYNPVTKQGFEQRANLIMEPGIQSVYLEMKNNFEALFKRKEWLSLEPIGLKGCALEVTGYAGTGLYKIYKDGELAVLGEIFLEEKELENFRKDLSLELKTMYDEIKVIPAQTLVFTKKFYTYNNIVKESIFSFCRIFGFSLLQILKEKR